MSHSFLLFQKNSIHGEDNNKIDRYRQYDLKEDRKPKQNNETIVCQGSRKIVQIRILQIANEFITKSKI